MSFNPQVLKISGKEEFVVSPARNVYMVIVKLSAEHQAVVGHGRISVTLRVMDDGHAGICRVTAVTDDNNPGAEIEPEARAEEKDYSPALNAVLGAPELEDNLQRLVTEYIDDAGGFDGLEEYYEEICPSPIASILAALGAK